MFLTDRATWKPKYKKGGENNVVASTRFKQKPMRNVYFAKRKGENMLNILVRLNPCFIWTSLIDDDDDSKSLFTSKQFSVYNCGLPMHVLHAHCLYIAGGFCKSWKESSWVSRIKRTGDNLSNSWYMFRLTSDRNTRAFYLFPRQNKIV